MLISIYVISLHKKLVYDELIRRTIWHGFCMYKTKLKAIMAIMSLASEILLCSYFFIIIFSNSTDDTDDNATPSREGRAKRGVANLYSMIKCSTGCDPLSYKGYGCYCGFLGNGKAVDAIDRCCKLHDYCYTVSKCPMYLEYFVPYLWKCYRGKPLCGRIF
jgi:hypothetical protein